MAKRDVEEALRDALKSAADDNVRVSAADVFERAGSRRPARALISAALAVVVVVAVSLGALAYMNLPAPQIANVSPTPVSTTTAVPSVPSAIATPAATGTPAGTEPAASATAAATGTPAPASDPSSWHSLVWQLPPQDAFISPGNQYMQGVTAFGAGFVGVGYDMEAAESGGASDGVIWTSSDGLAWERLSLSADLVAGNSLGQVIQTPSGLIAYGVSSMLVSLDGRQWRRVEYNIGRVARVGRTADGFLGRPAMAGDFNLLVSADGLTWQRVKTVGLEAAFLNTVTHNSFGYFAFGGDLLGNWGSWRSSGAVTWEPFELAPDIPASGVWSMAGSLFAGRQPCRTYQPGACGGIFRQSQVYRSDDGAAWTPIALPDQAPYRLGDHIYWTGDWMVGVPQDLQFGEPLLVSSDGLTWQSVGSRRAGELDAPGASFPDFGLLVLGARGVLIVGAAISDSGPTAVDPVVWFGAADDGTLPAQTFAPRP